MELVVINRPRVFPFRREYEIAKRIMDVVICLVFLPVLLPVMFICALAVKLDSRGPVLFIQERIGKGGRPFRMYKFRTMQHKLDNSYHQAFMKAYINGQVDGAKSTSAKNGNGRCMSIRPTVSAPFGKNGNGRVYKPIKVSQVTRVGRVLRKTSLDELPQIFNVLRGEMSLIGPRPNVCWEVEEYRDWHHERLEVLPGITGLAQVRGRSGISFNRIVQYDIEYVENRSTLLDLKILWWTLVTVLVGTGAE